MKSITAVGLVLLTACSATGGPVPTTAPPTSDTANVASTPGPTATTTTTTTGEATWAITSIWFGPSGRVELTNLGPDAGDPGGLWLNGRPLAVELPSMIVNPGARVLVAVGPMDPGPEAHFVPATGLLGPFDAAAGELGLYDQGTFGDPSALLDYVQWGNPDQIRSGVAVAAGLWPDQGAVVPAAGSVRIEVVQLPTTGPDEWLAVASE